MGKPSKKVKVPSSEEEEEEELAQEEEDLGDEEEYDQDDEDGILQAYQRDHLADQYERNQELLSAIEAKAKDCPEEEQLTWNAIYALKKQEAELTEQMTLQIETLKEKYELLKQPLYKQISSVALGNKVDSKLYKPEGLPCRGDPTKVQPLPIPNFWGEILEKEGLLNSQVDVECIQKIKEFTCELIEQKTNHLRIIFKFTSQNSYFSNLELQVDTKFNLETNERTREIKEEIKYKKARDEKSIFTMLFDSSTDFQETCNFATELYQDYSNAIFFYFSQEEEGLVGEDDDEEQDQDQDEQSEEVAPVKPTKKGKIQEKKKEKKNEKKEKKQIEKPQCKQQ